MAKQFNSLKTSLMTIVDQLNTLDLEELFKDGEKALEFAFQSDMLYDGGECHSTHHCSGTYIVIKDSYEKTGFRLQCNTCKKKKSIFYNSIFTRSMLGVNQILHLLYCWSQECSVEYSAFECDVSQQTAINFFQAFRMACKHWLQVEGQPQIGGVGLNVEIDETIISKRKNHAGRVLNEVWVFGGICRETRQRFALRVPNRSAATLLPLIQMHIEAGSTIHSDCWAAYNGIDSLPEAYSHLTVNHSQNFVDPITRSHTQTVERMWREVKRIRRRYEGINTIDIDDHIAEYLWRSRNVLERSQAFGAAIILMSGCPFF